MALNRTPSAPVPDFRGMVGAQKTFGDDPHWTLDSHDSDKYILNVPLVIDGVITQGVFLSANCHKSMPDHDVTFMLIYKPAYGYSGALIRLDWNPSHTHCNVGYVSGEWKWKEIRETHIHPFTDNYARGMQWMFEGNLPIAFPIDRPLPNFREMLAYFGREAGILDIQRVRPPTWEPKLL